MSGGETIFRFFSPRMRKRSTRRWLDTACVYEEPQLDRFLWLSCSQRSCSFGFSPTLAAPDAMLMLNTRTTEVVKIRKSGRWGNHDRTLRCLVSVVRDYAAILNGRDPDPEPVERGDRWIMLGLEPYAALMVFDPPKVENHIGIVRGPYSIDKKTGPG